jgi:hypothetical protein
MDAWNLRCKRGCITVRSVCTMTVKVSVDPRWFGDGWAPLHHSDRDFVR